MIDLKDYAIKQFLKKKKGRTNLIYFVLFEWEKVREQ